MSRRSNHWLYREQTGWRLSLMRWSAFITLILGCALIARVR